MHVIPRVALKRALAFGCLFAGICLAQAPKLQVTVTSGEGQTNNIKAASSRELSVTVTDEKGQPVGRALVTFELPAQGASGTFSGASKTTTVTADAQGKASVSR